MKSIRKFKETESYGKSDSDLHFNNNISIKYYTPEILNKPHPNKNKIFIKLEML